MTPEQHRASNPDVSAWVSASAGTGKTHVLTARVLRLLLRGARPDGLLCLTFTKAAAAEMANRIQERLAGWVIASEAGLAKALQDLDVVPDEAAMERARQLFALVLDSPGGLKIRTIHAFCQSLLGRFPLEAGLSPDFEALDENGAAGLIGAACAGVLASPDRNLSAAVELLTAQVNEADLTLLLYDVVRRSAGLLDVHDRLGGTEALVARARALLGLGGERDDPAAILAAACADGAFDRAGLQACVAALAGGSKRDGEKSAAIAAWLAHPERVSALAAYGLAFLTKDGKIRSPLATKAVCAAVPDVEACLEREARRLLDVLARAALARAGMLSEAVLRAGAAAALAYRDLKRRRRAIDFADMIERVGRLLSQEGRAAWVLYKLDQGIDHVLVDEAQDTSAEQWRILRALTDEFFAGHGARDTRPQRTLFVVGDLKQSIFSFQGASPRTFETEQDRLAARFEGHSAADGPRLDVVPLNLSFRSTDAVLKTVDRIFAGEGARAGVSRSAILHAAFRQGAAGCVELWPLEAPQALEAPAVWEPTLTPQRGENVKAALARRIARTIRRWLDAGEMLPARGRPVTAGDIMILVRRRNDFVTALVAECKRLGVPVAGADRMVLRDQLAVQDLVALGRFCLLPEDDYTLACVLKGPFIGLDDDDLIELAPRRGGRSLWAELRDRAEGRFVGARVWLEDRLAEADFSPPFEFYVHVLDRLGGRSRLLGRLGRQAADPIEEFLSAALAFEQRETPSLEAFLHAAERSDTQIKRDLEQARGEVRILTVHASKGLEAPVVILPDTTGNRGARGVSDRLTWSPEGIPLWLAGAEPPEGPAAWAAEAARVAEEERRRLFYVALTRAEDRLIVAGWHTGKADGPGFEAGSWYDLAAPAFADAPLVEIEPGFAVRRLATQQTAATDDGRREPPRRPGVHDMPEWARRPAPAEPRPSRPLAPSRPQDAGLPALSPLSLGPGRFRRGRVVHRLLELLPDLDHAARPAAGLRYALGQGVPEAAAAPLVEEVLAILDDPGFAAVFGPGSRAEVPVAAVIGTEVVMGRLDRLAFVGDRILIVDYKSDRPAPASVEAVAPGYLRQMALYRAALARIYPGRPVEAAVLWTEGPHLLALPGGLLDACLGELGAEAAPSPF